MGIGLTKKSEHGLEWLRMVYIEWFRMVDGPKTIYQNPLGSAWDLALSGMDTPLAHRLRTAEPAATVASAAFAAAAAFECSAAVAAAVAAAAAVAGVVPAAAAVAGVVPVEAAADGVVPAAAAADGVVPAATAADGAVPAATAVAAAVPTVVASAIVRSFPGEAALAFAILPGTSARGRFPVPFSAFLLLRGAPLAASQPSPAARPCSSWGSQGFASAKQKPPRPQVAAANTFIIF